MDYPNDDDVNDHTPDAPLYQDLYAFMGMQERWHNIKEDSADD